MQGKTHKREHTIHYETAKLKKRLETLPKSASEDRRVRGLSNPYIFSFTAAKVVFIF